MKNVSANSRYIYGEFINTPQGLGHQMGILQIQLIRYAAAMQRIAVIPDQFPLDKKHNRGCDIDSDPYRYYDFDHMTYHSNTDETDVPLQCISVSDLDMSQFSERDIKVFDSKDGPAHISKEDNRNYRLIIIKHTTWNWLHTCDYRLPKVILPYSERIRSMAMQVINKMMESQESWDHQLSGSIEDNHLKLDYCCVHARRTDRSKANGSITMPMNIRCNLDANQDIDSSTLIYLMTDEPDDHFYDKLKEYYPNLFRYSDFPELYRLRYPVDGADPDNYLLFAIELQMQRMAKVAYKASLYNRSVYSTKGHKIPCQWWFWSKEKAEKLCLSRRQNLNKGLIEFYPYRMLWYKFVNRTIYLTTRIRESIAFRLAKLIKH